VGTILHHSRFVLRAHSLAELVRLGTMTGPCARFLEAAVVAGLNIVTAGATQAGKTTLLNCLAAAIPPRERVITCEEAAVSYPWQPARFDTPTSAAL
jgi:pilus assembly protein CpaF